MNYYDAETDAQGDDNGGAKSWYEKNPLSSITGALNFTTSPVTSGNFDNVWLISDGAAADPGDASVRGKFWPRRRLFQFHLP